MAFTILACSSLAVRAKPLTTPTCKVGLKQKQNSVQFRDITGLKDKAFAIIESFHVLAKIKDMFYLIHFFKNLLCGSSSVSTSVLQVSELQAI